MVRIVEYESLWDNLGMSDIMRDVFVMAHRKRERMKELFREVGKGGEVTVHNSNLLRDRLND